MGAVYRYECDKCGYSVSTSGPWEFYRDGKGKRKPYGHPGPTSKEAEKRGIHGLSGELYCPRCDKTFDLVLVEFKEPCEDNFSVWVGMQWEPKDEFERKDAVKCPKCGNTNLVFEPDEDGEIICPRCKEGKLVGEMVLIS